MKPNEITKCGFEQRELIGKDYWDDPRWKEVAKLRDTGTPENMAKANGLVFAIRYDWGVD
jgi:hypothetical protein